MSEQLEPRPIWNDHRTSTVKSANREIPRDMKRSECCVCDCRICKTYADVQQHGRDAVRAQCRSDSGMHGVGVSGSPTTSTARRQANLQYTNLRFRQSLHTTGTSKPFKKRTLRKRRLRINLKVKYFTKQTIKCLKKIKFMSTRSKVGKKSTLKRNRKINLSAKPRRINNNVGKTADRLQLDNSINALKKRTIIRSVSSSNATHSRKRRKANGYNPVKVIAAKLFSKFVFYLKPLFHMIMKSRNTKESSEQKHMPYETSRTVLNYIYPYQSNSSNTLNGINIMEWGNQSSALDAASNISSARNSSIQSFNDQEIQISEHSAVQTPVIIVEPVVKKRSTCIVYSQCILRPNDELLQYRKDIPKMVIKKSRRVTFRGHHKRFMTKTYKQNFNKMYHTFMAEINYTNQPLQLCQTNRQGVKIGSTWDVNIDLGRSQDSPKQPGADPGTGTLQPFQCPPGACVAGACDPKKCFKQLKRTTPYGSHASSQSRNYKLRDQRAGRYNKNGGKKLNKTKRKINKKGGGKSTVFGNQIAPASAPAGLPSRQAVRIGSNCSFNVKVYKETPLGARALQLKNLQSSGRNGQGIQSICDPSDCYRRQKGIVTETSLACTSNCSSQVSTQSRKLKGRDLRSGRETIYKDKGTLSKPRPKARLNMPNRQAVRIGSKCSFNVEFYKCSPQNALCEQGRGDTSDGRKGIAKTGKDLKKYQCEPGVCIPGKCNKNECYQQLKLKECYGTDASSGSLKNTSQGSQASTKAPKKRQDLRAEQSSFYKDRGVSCMPRSTMPLCIGNRQAVRIGSTCSFNIEFYKCSPQNGSAMRPMSEQGGMEENHKPLKKYQCQPGVCVRGRCNANECFQVLKTKYENSVCDSSMTGSSRGSQATSKRRKDKTRMLKSGKATFYKSTGVSSLPCPRKPLLIPNRQAVRIGSTCSFNIEFYKSMPQNNSVVSGQNYQSANRLQNKAKPRGIFECEPDVCIPGKCNPSECFKQFECKPELCVPGKCDPVDCLQRLRGTSAGTDASFTGSSVSTQSRKFKRGKLGAVDKSLYRETGVSCISRQKPTLCTPNRQAVRIGSTCSFNIEFYKAMSHPMTGDQGKSRVGLKKYECVPGVCDRGKCDKVECYHRIKRSQMSEDDQSDSSGRRKSRKKRKVPNKYSCDPGACMPGKCDAKECFEILKAKQNIGKDGSLTDSSLPTSRASQASKKRKSKRPEIRAGNARFLTERGASSMPRSKTPLHLQNRQSVRIGSTCSFNIEFYKGMPHNRLGESYAQQMQNVQHPFQYNIDENKQHTAQYPISSPSSSDTPSTTGKKGKGKFKQKKQPAGQLDQGDTTVQHETASRTGVKNKESRRKTTKGKQSSSKKEQGDATIKPTLTTETKGQAVKQKRTKRKQSQTSVRDQQSETSVDEKVGTGKGLPDHIDKPVQPKVETKKTGKSQAASKDGFEYELGVCIPNKCDPYLCFDRLKNRPEGTKASLGTKSKHTPESSDSGSISKTTSVNLGRKEEAERRKTRASTLPVYKDMGISSIATNKSGEDIPQRIQSPGIPGRKKQVVRIGSTCSFNFQIFKDKPLTPAEIASLRSASTPPKPELAEVKKEKVNFTTSVKNCFCRLLGQFNEPACKNAVTGKQHGSQTSQKFACMQCNVRNPCSSRFSFIDAGTDAFGKAKRAVQSCCTNAATQSRRCPGLQQLSFNDNTLNAALCKCLAKMGPSRALTGQPNAYPYTSPGPGNWPFVALAGYGDNFNRYHVREQAIILGSGCGFNVNIFKKRK